MKKMTKVLSTVAMSGALFLSGYSMSIDQQSPLNVKVSESKVDAKIIDVKRISISRNWTRATKYVYKGKSYYADGKRYSKLAHYVAVDKTNGKIKYIPFAKVIYKKWCYKA